MTVIGKQLLQPENGWKRIDDRDLNISYSDSPVWEIVNRPGNYLDSVHQAVDFGTGAYAQFNFKGTKIRLISVIYIYYSTDTSIIVDGIVYPFNINGATTVQQAVVFELTGLSDGEHSVIIKQNTPALDASCGIVFDAIDIDEDGEIKPYNPTIDPPSNPEPTNTTLLRITMIDSSEREYKVSKAEADGFVAWMNRDVNTGTTAYPLTKVITESKEYLLFDKIISFEVKELK